MGHGHQALVLQQPFVAHMESLSSDMWEATE